MRALYQRFFLTMSGPTHMFAGLSSTPSCAERITAELHSLLPQCPHHFERLANES
jgi:hypothetical protein